MTPSRDYRRAAGWLILAVVGQAASLTMIAAGPSVHYQHYPPLATLVARHPWSLALVLLQSLVVWGALLRRIRKSSLSGWTDGFGVRMTVAVLLSMCVAATVSPQPLRYVGELAFAAYLQCLALATIVLLAMDAPPALLQRVEHAVDRGLGRSDEGVTPDRGLDRFAWSAAAVSVCLAAALNVASYERLPHVPDEVAYLHHAKYFAKGLLTMPAPAVPEAFEVDLMEYEPARWYSPVPVGWPAVLALGAVVDAPWLVNPLLTGANVLLAYLLLGQLYSRRVARGATALLAISPWALFLGMSYMTQPLTLTCALVAAVGVAYAKRTGTVGWSILAGAGVGATSLVRPLDGVIVGLLIAAWAIGIGGARLRLPQLAGMLAGTVVIGALVLPYNRAITGEPLRFPINAYTDKHYAPGSNAYGFGANRGLGWPSDPNPGHTPLDGLINTNLNAFGINGDLFGWSTGSLILIAWILCSGALRRGDWLMIVAGLSFPVAYFFNYFSGGPDFGARYWFPIIVPLVALSARGIQALERPAGARVWLAVVALSAMMLVTYVPWRAMDKYHNYRGMRADVRTLAAEHQFGADLVLVRGKRFPDYAGAFAHNPVDLQSLVPIYAWDRSADVRSAVLRAYADRRVWLIDGPSITGSGYRVVGGPLEARALLTAGSQ